MHENQGKRKTKFKVLLLILIIAGLGFTYYQFQQLASESSERLEVAGWTIEAPAGWSLWRQESLEVVIAAPGRVRNDSDGNSNAVFIYYNPRQWPHSDIDTALIDLKQRPENSEFEIIESNHRRWLINKYTKNNQIHYFARTIAGKNQHYTIRADGHGTDIKQYLLEVLKKTRI